MKTTMIFDNCLTYEHLQAYVSNESNKTEKAHVYKHISSCELCACAINGFTAIPFSLNDINAIQHTIDLKTNAINAKLISLPQALIAIVSLVSVFCFYKYADSFSKAATKTIESKKILPLAVVQPLLSNFVNVANGNTVPKTIKVDVKKDETLAQEKTILPLVSMEKLTATLIDSKSMSPEDPIKSVYNSDIIYLYDLKITDYFNLYFYHSTLKADFKNNIPASAENKETVSNRSETESNQIIAANVILKKGLYYFSKEQFSDAIVQFQLLLENNPNDVNALFYSGVAYSKIENYSQSIKKLELVLHYSNTTFYPEAKWNLALAYIKTGNEIRAKQLLIEIQNENGFYAKRAEEIIKKR
jgi:hypothetical protein